MFQFLKNKWKIMNNIPDSEDKRECIRSLHKTRKHLNTMTKKKKKSSVNPPEICPTLPKCVHVGIGGMKPQLFKYVLMFLILIHQSFSR